jgi:hypothetical protein
LRDLSEKNHRKQKTPSTEKTPLDREVFSILTILPILKNRSPPKKFTRRGRVAGANSAQNCQKKHQFLQILRKK